MNVLHAIWAKMRFRRVLLLTLLLAVVGELYPFSNFPMYSNFFSSATVVYVRDEAGRPLAMWDEFGYKTSNAKKQYRSELKAICRKAGLKTEQAGEAERAAAGKAVLEFLLRTRKSKRRKLPPLRIQELQLMQKTIRLEGSAFSETDLLLARLSLS